MCIFQPKDRWRWGGGGVQQRYSCSINLVCEAAKQNWNRRGPLVKVSSAGGGRKTSEMRRVGNLKARTRLECQECICLNKAILTFFI